MGRRITPPLERFYRHVRREGACLIWTSTVAGTKSRAGTFRPGSKWDDPKVYAHRWIYEQLVGPIPEGYDIDHVKARGCSGSLCVEITHLEAVPHSENMRRARLDVCRSGKHDLTNPENVRWDSQGRRRGCKVCHKEKYDARYYADLEATRAKRREAQRQRKGDSHL